MKTSKEMLQQEFNKTCLHYSKNFSAEHAKAWAMRIASDVQMMHKEEYAVPGISLSEAGTFIKNNR